jgi:hypothetical protein
VQEVALSCHEKSNASLDRCSRDLVVSHRATRMHNSPDPGINQNLKAVMEWEEGIGRRH